MPTSMTQDNQTYYLHYDQVGTLRAITDTSHNIIKEVTYDTYGNILSDTNQNFKIPFGFAGGLYDTDTKLTRFGYRDYDAYTGKWTAKDPIDFSGGDTNLYGYVLGDPVNFIDPTGEFALSWVLRGLGAYFLWYNADKYANDVFDNNATKDYENNKEDFYDFFKNRTKEFCEDVVLTNRPKR